MNSQLVFLLHEHMIYEMPICVYDEKPCYIWDNCIQIRMFVPHELLKCVFSSKVFQVVTRISLKAFVVSTISVISMVHM